MRDIHHAVERARAAGLRVVDEDFRDPRWQEAFISPRSAFGTIVQLAQTNMSHGERERHWSIADFSHPAANETGPVSPTEVRPVISPRKEADRSRVREGKEIGPPLRTEGFSARLR